MDDFDDFDDLLSDAPDEGEPAEVADDALEIDPYESDLSWGQWEAAFAEYVDAGQIDPEALDDLREWYEGADFGDWEDFMVEFEGDDADSYE